ncbi:penicillin acylase family protein [Candidatus Chloroploca asiatica]|nr:penicillin acylase family protein [Candidatus Chloroploca asiatica]
MSMFDFSRLARAFGLTMGLAAGAAGVGALAALRRPLPRTTGRVALPGLTARATVHRDRWGIPHLYASTNQDLFATLGFVHSQDRLWQMELHRRTARGQLAEIFGPIALSSDQFIRTLGFSRVAECEAELIDAETASLLEAYITGINQGVEALHGRLPLEYTILGFQPRPWELVDILAWPKMMALNLSTNWMSEIFNAQMVALVGEDRAAALATRFAEHELLTLPRGTRYPDDLGATILRLAGDATRFTGDTSGPQGSNAWAVSGDRTVHGRPLLANDPHLGLGLPGLWYLAHLEGGDFHVAGVTMPGTCGVVIGHNRDIAWGMTNAPIDIQDLYLERLHPEDPTRYAWQGEWRTMETLREEIVVKGQKEVVLVDVQLTNHGPIIDQVRGRIGDAIVDPGPNTALALRWTALDPSPALSRAVLKLNRARNWDEFRAALADWHVPPQNFVYADTRGQIGYALAGKIPLRPHGHPHLPVPGWDGAYEWQGFLPPEHVPASLNPPDGMVVTANNRIVGPEHPLAALLQGEYANPYRAERITTLLEATERHDTRSFAQIQQDALSLPGLKLARLIATLELSDPLEQAACELLVAWDGVLSIESSAATVYDSLRYHLTRVTYRELDGLLGVAAAVGAFSAIPSNIYLEHALPTILARIEATSLPDRPDPWLGNERTWNEVLAQAFSRAVAELRTRLGPEPKRWVYKRVHTLTLRHPLGSVPALASLFNRGPWPMVGDVDTVNHQYVPRETAAGPAYNGPSYRQILDPGDWDNARVIIPTGQSGHPASKHYASLTSTWRTGGYLPLFWTREAVERHTVETLILESA